MIDYWLIGASFILSFGVAYLITPFMQIIAKKTNIVSLPTRRSINTKPVPYLGGVAIFISFACAMAVIFNSGFHFIRGGEDKLFALILASFFVVALGIWDDIKDISAGTKFLGQIVAALFLFINGFRIEVLTNPLLGDALSMPLALSLILTVLWIVGIMNAMNLIDGLDGLAAGISAVISLCLFLVSLYLGNYTASFLLIILAGSSLGFLKYNFHPAKIFMGDAGSMFLGLMLAASALIELEYKSATAVVLLVPITALAIPLYDTFMAVVRRTKRRRSIFKADKMHLHHRLLDLGLKHRQIVIFLYLVTIYLGLFSFLFVLIPERYSVILLGLLTIAFFIGIRLIVFVERKIRRMRKLEKKVNQ